MKIDGKALEAAMKANYEAYHFDVDKKIYSCLPWGSGAIDTGFTRRVVASTIEAYEAAKAPNIVTLSTLRSVYTDAVAKSTSTLDSGPENDGWIAVIQYLKPLLMKPTQQE